MSDTDDARAKGRIRWTGGIHLLRKQAGKSPAEQEWEAKILAAKMKQAEHDARIAERQDYGSKIKPENPQADARARAIAAAIRAGIRPTKSDRADAEILAAKAEGYERGVDAALMWITTYETPEPPANPYRVPGTESIEAQVTKRQQELEEFIKKNGEQDQETK